MPFVSSRRREPRPLRRMAIPPPQVASRRGWHPVDMFAAGLIVVGIATSVMLGAAALLGSLWLLLWLAREVVGLFA
jgi:hypothetical protein